MKINQIYKVKEGHEGKCGMFKKLKGRYIIITSKNTFNIFNEYKWYVGECVGGCCFTEDDLELEEEVKEKSLEDLEVGDEVKDIYGNIFEVDDIKIEKTYKLSDDISIIERKPSELKAENYQIVKSLSPSEAETLLEEKLGIKVKIKN